MFGAWDGEPTSPAAVFAGVTAASAASPPTHCTPPHPERPPSPSPPPSQPLVPTAIDSAQDAFDHAYHVPSVASTAPGDAPPSSSRPDEAAHVFLTADATPARLPRGTSFGEHRVRVCKHRRQACSIDSASIPRQTLLKALQSRPPPPPPGSMDAVADTPPTTTTTTTPPSATAATVTTLPAAHRHLAIEDASMAKMAALASPCFVHRKFDGAVNLAKVLDELHPGSDGDDHDAASFSHSRLVQTACSVREVSKQLQRRPINMTVRNVMIVTKARDNSLVHLTRDLAEWLLTTPRYGSDAGVNVYVDHKLRTSTRFDAPSLLAQDPRFATMLRWWTPDLCWETPELFDLVLTLGGDGTVLFTSWLFQRIVPPILSFSLGSLGFLTNFDFAHHQSALNKVMSETGMRVNLRMRFTCTVYRYQKNAAHGSPHHMEAEQFEVLNELVIDRGPSPYVSNLELYGDNNLLTVVQADGVIFSTPTGSTAYSLSAGGSLVHPDIPAILLTPICPHTLSFRPMLLNDSMLLRIAVPTRSRATAYCAFDGKGRVELRQGDHVTIAASQYPFPTVLSQPTEWFDSISRTLRWNSRGATQQAWVGDDTVDDDNQEPQFDIDFDHEDIDRDSGYSAEGSTLDGRASPQRKGKLLPFL